MLFENLASIATLLINTYFSCDSLLARDVMEETIEVLEIIRRTVETSRCDSVLWCGDINSDFRRISRQVELVQDIL